VLYIFRHSSVHVLSMYTINFGPYTYSRHVIVNINFLNLFIHQPLQQLSTMYVTVKIT
jgi:hypothetical protein